MYDTKSEEEYKPWTLGVNDVSVGSPFVTNVPLWWTMLTVREFLHVWCERMYRKSVYFALIFAVNLKLP